MTTLFVFAASAHATTWTVSDTSDNATDTGSLRYALTNATNGDTINFSVTGTITLGSALPAITQNLAIAGPGAQSLTISGGGAYTVFTINSGAIVSVSGLTIANGHATSPYSGAGILNEGNLTVSNSAFSGNSASGSYCGGGILNYANSATATLTVSNSTFSGNSAAGAGGGAIDNLSSTVTGTATATLTVNNSTFSGNSTSGGDDGGGIENFSSSVSGTATATAEVNDSTFSGNSASGGNDGGGINSLIESAGTLTVNNNIFSGNSAGGIDEAGGIEILGTITEANNLFYNNSSGDAFGFSPSTSDITNENPMLLPLGAYGGMTETMLPQPGSAAICAGNATLVSAGVTTDQRGFALSGSNCTNGGVDVGAVQTNYLMVTTDVDSGAGSLRDAITTADVSGGDIDFAASLNGGTITLASGLEITGAVNIIGPGAGNLTISGNNATTVLTIDSLAQVMLCGVTIADGNGVHGGAILVAGTLAVADSVFSANTANLGGGIFDGGGSLTVADSTFENNTSSPAGQGGGINIDTGVVTVTNSTFAGNVASGNLGGGVFNFAGTVTVTNSTFSGNSSDNGGGVYSSGTTTLNNDILSGNSATSAGAGVDNNGGTLNASNNVYYQNVDAGTTEDDCDNCTSNVNPVSTISPLLAALGSYGGPTPTMLPLPGGGAICAGQESLALDGNGNALTADQRGFALGVSSYCTSGSIDAGAVQTNYTSLQFTNAGSGYTGTIGQIVAPGPIVSVTENGQNIGAIPITLAFTGLGTASGLGPMTTVGGTGATFSNLTVDTVDSSDTLSATLPITSTTSLITNPIANLNITATPTTLAPTVTPSSSYPYGSTAPMVSVSLTPTNATGITAADFTATLDGSTALTVTAGGGNTYSITGIPVTIASGPHSIVVNFIGTADFATSSVTIPLSVNMLNTSVTVSSSGNSTVDQQVTFTATVSSASGTGSPTGNVTVTDTSSSTVLCSAATVTGGQATCMTSSLTAGSHAIAAVYNGDTNFNASTNTTNTVTQTVAKANTSTTVASSNGGPSAVNAPLTFTASVTPFNGAVALYGTVAFTDNGKNISGCSAVAVTPASGQAMCTTSSLNAGTHSIVATYSQDSNYNTSDNSVPQTVTSASSSLGVVSSQNPSVVTNPNNDDDLVVFTATVTPSSGPVMLSGAVTFTDNGAPIAACPTAVPVTPSTGIANCATTGLVFGTHTILAAYSGDPNFAASSSSVTQTVQDYALAASPTSAATITQGFTNSNDPFSPQVITVSATPAAGFTGNLALTCNVVPITAPSGATAPLCNLGSSMLPVTTGASQQPVSVTINAGGGSTPVASPGTYSVSVVGVDSATGLTHSTASFLVNVRYTAVPITLVSGATIGNTSTIDFTLPADVSVSNWQCVSVTGPGLTPSLTPASLTLGCTFSPASASPSTSTQVVSVAATISTGTTNTAMLRVNQKGPMIVAASLLGIPILALLGFAPAGNSSRKIFLRYLGIVIAIVVILQGIGCGGGSLNPPTSNTGLTPPGSYDILVQGTGSDNQEYQAVIQVNVTR